MKKYIIMAFVILGGFCVTKAQKVSVNNVEFKRTSFFDCKAFEPNKEQIAWLIERPDAITGKWVLLDGTNGEIEFKFNVRPSIIKDTIVSLVNEWDNPPYTVNPHNLRGYILNHWSLKAWVHYKTTNYRPKADSTMEAEGVYSGTKEMFNGLGRDKLLICMGNLNPQRPEIPQEPEMGKWKLARAGVYDNDPMINKDTQAERKAKIDFANDHQVTVNNYYNGAPVPLGSSFNTSADPGNLGYWSSNLVVDRQIQSVRNFYSRPWPLNPLWPIVPLLSPYWWY